MPQTRTACALEAEDGSLLSIRRYPGFSGHDFAERPMVEISHICAGGEVNVERLPDPGGDLRELIRGVFPKIVLIEPPFEGWPQVLTQASPSDADAPAPAAQSDTDGKPRRKPKSAVKKAAPLDVKEGVVKDFGWRTRTPKGREPYSTYVVTLLNDEGRPVEAVGSALDSLITDNQVQIGDRVRLTKTNTETIKVDKGEKQVNAKKNLWDLERLDA